MLDERGVTLLVECRQMFRPPGGLSARHTAVMRPSIEPPAISKAGAIDAFEINRLVGDGSSALRPR
jgi:hypothetical protein